MKMSARALALSVAGAFAIICTLCSLLVRFFPASMLTMTGHMFHADLDEFRWTLSWSGYVMGMLTWVVWAGITGWLAATIYNKVNS